MRCIVIDDEKLALELTCSYISKVPFLELTGTFTDPFDAMDFLMKNPVDLVFTDIEMHDINGVQLISSLNHRPKVIFITAYERYAIDSYSLDAVDYLLKPVSFERFLKAVNKAYENRQHSENAPDEPAIPNTPLSAPTYIFVKADGRLVKLFYSDILFIEGYGDYVKYHLRDNRMLLSLQNLGELENRLSSNFARVHRSFIVAIDKIEEIERKRIKIGKHLIPISDSYHDEFIIRLQN
ncbi:LytTR family DNA-binding domain-containing protein [Alistipes sp. OttesenSCG-928-B03]|nr:LytTR family DNA-binding domain-containing protein [Alistipes sp. OttesenSCG-928-B03]